MKVLLTALATMALVIGIAAPGRAQPVEPRIAFVVGNGGYARGPLPIALNDAGLVAEALRSIGFEIVEGADASQADIVRDFRAFLTKVEAAGPDTIAFVYFSGYAFTFDNDNLLVAADARLERDTDIPLDTIRLGDLLRPLAGAPARARIVVLDAARQLPFALQGVRLARGLAAIEPAPGMLVAMSAAPGALIAEGPGPYGAYATAIAEMIRVGGLDIAAAFTRIRARTHQLTQGAQTPWHVSGVDPQVMLVPPDPTAPPPPVRRPRPMASIGPEEAYSFAIEQDTLPGYIEFVEAYPRHPFARRVWAIIRMRREALAWLRARDFNTPESYWTYLRRYPDGIYAPDAERRLRRLSAAFAPPPGFAPIEFVGVPPPLPGEPVLFIDTLAPGPPPPFRLIGPPPAIYLNLAPPRPRGATRTLPAAASLPGVRGFPPGGRTPQGAPAAAGAAAPAPGAAPGKPPVPLPGPAANTIAAPGSPLPGAGPPSAAGANAAPPGAGGARRGPSGRQPAAALPPAGAPGGPPAANTTLGRPPPALRTGPGAPPLRGPNSVPAPSALPNPPGAPAAAAMPPGKPIAPVPPMGAGAKPPGPPNAALNAPPPANAGPPGPPPTSRGALAPPNAPPPGSPPNVRGLPPPGLGRSLPPPPQPPAINAPKPLPPPVVTAPKPPSPPPPQAINRPPPPPVVRQPPPPPPQAISRPPPPAVVRQAPPPPAAAAAPPKPAPAAAAAQKKCTVENGQQVCR